MKRKKGKTEGERDGKKMGDGEVEEWMGNDRLKMRCETLRTESERRFLKREVGRGKRAK